MEDDDINIDVGDYLIDSSLSQASQNTLDQLLEDDEHVVAARPRSFFYQQKMLIGISVLGTIAFVALLIYQLVAHYLRFLYYFLMMIMFPVFLVGLIIQGFRSLETFVAVTNKRVIQWEGHDHVLLIPLDKILSCASRTNYLKLNKEIELKVLPLREFHTTSISRQSPFKLEYVDGLDRDREMIERLIQERIPVQNQTILNNPAPTRVDDFL
jgi:hypothetical protein